MDDNYMNFKQLYSGRFMVRQKIFITRDGIRLTINSQYYEAFLAYGLENLTQLIKQQKGKIIQNGNRSTVFSSDLKQQGLPKKIIVKRYKFDDLWWVFRLVFKSSRARRSWYVSWKFLEKGINVPVPLVWGEKRTCRLIRESFIVTEKIEAVVLEKHLRNLNPPFTLEQIQLKEQLIIDFAYTLKDAHNKGFFSDDLNVSNILIKTDNNKTTFWFLDFDGAECKKHLSLQGRVKNLLRLNNNIRSLEPDIITKEDKIKFLKSYAGDDTDLFQVLLKKTRCREKCLVTKDGIRLIINSQYYEAFLAYGLENLVQLIRQREGCMIKDGNRTTIFSLRLNQRGLPQKMMVKCYIHTDKRKILKFLFKSSHARRSWYVSWKFLEEGINVPVPLVWGEKRTCRFIRESFIITEEIETPTLAEYLKQFKSPITPEKDKLKEQLIIDFAQTLRYAHDNGFFTTDFTACNIMAKTENNKTLFWFLDFDTAKWKKCISINKRVKNFLRFNKSIRNIEPDIITKTDKIKFLKSYAGDDTDLFQVLFKKTKCREKCLVTKDGIRLTINSQYYEAFLAVDIEHIVYLIRQQKGRMLKNGSRSTVFSLNLNSPGLPEKVVVKYYKHNNLLRTLKILFRHSYAKRSWYVSWKFLEEGINVPVPLVWGEKRTCRFIRESFIITEEIETPTLIEYLKQFKPPITPEKDKLKEQLIIDFAHTLRDAHDRGFFTDDLKASNIMVKTYGDKTIFCFIDLDGDDCKKHLSIRMITKSLSSLNNSLPDFITKENKLRFLKVYAGDDSNLFQKLFIRLNKTCPDKK